MSELVGDDGKYGFEGREATPEQLTDFWAELVARYPIVSIEDGAAEEDWTAWKALTERLGERVQLVGDDLFVTNVERLRRGIEDGVANSILVKVNQIGTLTESLEAIAMARSAGYTADLPPFRRDGRHDDCRSRRRHERRADQDRRALALRSHREVQPAAADRRGSARTPNTPAGMRSKLSSLARSLGSC